MPPKVYLAGPDVFRADALEIAAKKKKICTEYGLVGMFPLDNCIDLSGMDGRKAGLTIAEANEQLMRSADACIANMTPFRGPSMDVGTAFEMGFMRAQGKPVHGYTQSADSFAERTKAWCLKHHGKPHRERPDAGRPVVEDHDGNEIESFESLHDNLMLDGAVAASVNSPLEIGKEDGHDMGSPAALEPFRRCCQVLSAELGRLAAQTEEAMSPTAGSRSGLMFVESDDDFAVCLRLAGERIVVFHEFGDTPALQFRAEAKALPDVVFALRRDSPARRISFWVRGTEIDDKRIDCSAVPDQAGLRVLLHDTVNELDE
eukprot:Hpha_TRINITY_DN4978_c0_g1::TRINITY_DN4978_c0_g1_i1::g.51508::m.51508